MNGLFSKEDTQMAKELMKRRSVSLTIQEMEIKTARRYHSTPKMAKRKNTGTSLMRVWRNQNPLILMAGMQNDHMTQQFHTQQYARDN